MSDAVLLTGASTGIGRATTLRLAHAGMRVFAGVRKAEDGEGLRSFAGPNVVPLLLDVTDASAIAAAHEAVTRELGSDRFAGLVNNAGIAVAGPIEMLRDADWRRQFDVNFFGPVALTRTFIPLLRAHRGRIVNVGSIAGKLSTPYSAAYGASKHAMEAYSDALRVELAPQGIGVSLIEPGPVKTPIWKSGEGDADRRLNDADPDLLKRYEAPMQKMRQLAKEAESGGVEADVVARAIEHALVDPKPRARYLVGNIARVQLAISYLPERARDRILGSMVGHRK